MVLGALIAGVVALIVGVPTLRLKGDYLAIATLGVSEIIRILIVNGGTLTNGAAGILGLPAFTTWQMVYLFVVITTIFTINFLRSPIGRSTLSVREDEIAAESVGINTTKVKVTPLFSVRSQQRLQDLSKQVSLDLSFRKIILSPILLMS